MADLSRRRFLHLTGAAGFTAAAAYGLSVTGLPFIQTPSANAATPYYGAFGTYRPSNATSGFRTARTALVKYNYPGTAAVSLTSPKDDGRVFQGLEIFGDVIVNAKNVIFQDCLFRGPKNWPTNDSAIINCTGAGVKNLLVQDCTFVPQTPNYYRNAMIGREYTALRNRSIWCNDDYGVYSQAPYNVATNVKIAGCYMSHNVYWHGTVAQWLGQSVSPFIVNGVSIPPYPLKTDGTHNDGVQIQGGLGGTRSIWVIGNSIRNDDAKQTDPHPLGWADPIPKLGTQDCPKRYACGTSTLQPMLNGRYASNGQAVIIQQNTYQFPQADTVVVENNWFNSSGQGVVVAARSGGYNRIKCTLQNNLFGESIYYYVPSNPSTYPVRIDLRSGATVVGLSTNKWFEGHWAPIGSILVEGRTSGIRYDA